MLKSVRRIKKRYISFKTSVDSKKIEKYLYEFFGVFSFGKVDVKFIKTGFEDIGIFTIRVNRKYFHDVLGALSLTSKSSTGFRVYTLTSSGSVKGIKKNIMEIIK